MAITLGTPTLVGTAANQSFSGSYDAPVGLVGLLLCPSERGAAAGTSPGTLTVGGTSALGTPVSPLTQITASQRAHRWYYYPTTTSGSQTIALTWAGADNVAVAVIPVFADGALSFPSSGSSDTNGTVTITAAAGDVTIGCAQANSAAPAFSPQSGQTEYLESVWYSNTGHSVGVSTGAQSAASWTGAGSICASAFVLHETSTAIDATIVETSPAAVDAATGDTTIDATIVETAPAAVDAATGDTTIDATIVETAPAAVDAATGDTTIDATIVETSPAAVDAATGDTTIDATIVETSPAAVDFATDIVNAVSPGGLRGTLEAGGRARGRLAAGGRLVGSLVSGGRLRGRMRP